MRDPGAVDVPLQVCRVEEVESRWLPLRDECKRKQEPGKGPAARSRFVLSATVAEVGRTAASTQMRA